MSSSTIPSPPSSPKRPLVQKRKADALPRLTTTMTTPKRQKRDDDRAAQQQQALASLQTYLQSGGPATLLTRQGHCLICCACSNHSLASLELLHTTTDLPLQHLCKDGKSGLHTAASVGFLDGLTFLLKFVNLNLQTKSDQWTALHYAVKANNVSAARLLLEHGARMDLVDRHGRLPLHMAVMNRHVDMVDLLLAAHHLSKNNPSHTDLIWHQQPNSAAERAVMAGYAPILARLLAKAACPAQLRPRLLSLTIEWNRIECLDLLVRQQGFRVNDAIHTDNHTCALIYAAVQQRKLDLVRALVAAGAKLCHAGWNPAFVYAANHGFMEMIPLLLTQDTSTHCIDDALTLVSPAARRHQLLAVILQTKLKTPQTPITPSSP
ncbi:ankyrin repeat-containing domain protein [Gongronella butleri]|nr:ankyrin repeat-containing domain protein [Gongronella butleri]